MLDFIAAILLFTGIIIYLEYLYVAGSNRSLDNIYKLYSYQRTQLMEDSANLRDYFDEAKWIDRSEDAFYLSRNYVSIGVDKENYYKVNPRTIKEYKERAWDMLWD